METVTKTANDFYRRPGEGESTFVRVVHSPRGAVAFAVSAAERFHILEPCRLYDEAKGEDQGLLIDRVPLIYDKVKYDDVPDWARDILMRGEP